MRTWTHLYHLLASAACVLALGACGTAPVSQGNAMAEVMGKAAAASSAGKKEVAIALWKQAAVAYPAEKEPWSRIAQTRYDAGQYGDAIVNAQEMLLRDPSDQLANSIIAISGLRLSTRALADLSRQNHLSGSIRTESQDLAKVLRESLGEQVLVPPVRDKAAPARAATVRKPSTKSSDAGEASANPFDVLK